MYAWFIRIIKSIDFFYLCRLMFLLCVLKKFLLFYKNFSFKIINIKNLETIKSYYYEGYIDNSLKACGIISHDFL